MMGNWVPSERNRHAGYNGSVFGPTSMVINNECSGEDAAAGGLFPGQGGENRRIKVKAGGRTGVTIKCRLTGIQMVLRKVGRQPRPSEEFELQRSKGTCFK
jgi:hypothetical protein